MYWRAASLQLAFSVAVATLPCVALADTPTEKFDALMSQAEAQRAGEHHVEASRNYAAAYYALGPEQRTGLLGEIALDNAWADYESSVAANTKPLAGLTQTVTAVLETAVGERSQAHRMGTADPTPRRWSKALLQLQPTPEPAALAEEPQPHHDVVTLHQPDANRPDTNRPDANQNRSRARPVLTAGVIGVIAGGGVIAVGLATWKRVDVLATQSRASLVNDAESDDVLENRRADIARWERRGRGVATGVIVGGSVLVATGAGFVVWHLLRKRKRNRTPAWPFIRYSAEAKSA
ncbi:MAG: hypothetical protein JKY37_15945 [Nannocystaceae bacterium]|nr:hypothetical protein [Nannocystaceae bacterium]